MQDLDYPHNDSYLLRVNALGLQAFSTSQELLKCNGDLVLEVTDDMLDNCHTSKQRTFFSAAG